MRKVLLSVVAVAAVLVSGSMIQRAGAVTIGAPAGMQGAADDLAVVDRVHCIPGWSHHYPTHWRRRDGCVRNGGVVVAPGRFWYGHHHHHRRHIQIHRGHVHVHRHGHHRHRR